LGRSPPSRPFKNATSAVQFGPGSTVGENLTLPQNLMFTVNRLTLSTVEQRRRRRIADSPGLLCPRVLDFFP
jgi:hypothetical protein